MSESTEPKVPSSTTVPALEQNGNSMGDSTHPTDSLNTNTTLPKQSSREKGKSKEVSHPSAVVPEDDDEDDEDGDDDEEDDADEEEEMEYERDNKVGNASGTALVEKDNEDEDPLEGLDMNDIMPTGRRTRGKQINFKQVAETMEGDMDDEDDDDDFKGE